MVLFKWETGISSFNIELNNVSQLTSKPETCFFFCYALIVLFILFLIPKLLLHFEESICFVKVEVRINFEYSDKILRAYNL